MLTRNSGPEIAIILFLDVGFFWRTAPDGVANDSATCLPHSALLLPTLPHQPRHYTVPGTNHR